MDDIADLFVPWFDLQKGELPELLEVVLTYDIEDGTVGIDYLNEDPDDPEYVQFRRHWTHWLPIPDVPRNPKEHH